MEHTIDRSQIEAILQAEDLTGLSGDEMARFFLDEAGLRKYLPDGVCRQDPRDGANIIYNSARAKRPHHIGEAAPAVEPDASKCPVCNGNTTGILDVAELSSGVTFINKNLFPILYPQTESQSGAGRKDVLGERSAFGYHFLQWTSSVHTRDWQNMPLADLVVVVRRLAALERKLLFDSGSMMPDFESWDNVKNARGFVSIIKNFGKLVGGSLAHGHQQIGFSNIMPRAFRNNLQYAQKHGELFADTMVRDNPAHLQVADFGSTVLLVPYFMKRPYAMMLFIKDTSRQYVCELGDEEVSDLAAGIHHAVRAILTVMPDSGRTSAYNFVIHNGPGAGLYVEFLPYTQETGGFEHLGLWVCQNNPENVAKQLKDVVGAGR
ncbi:MAG: hypothetical protein K9N51_09435 [Candidatus Pacebacteria bacterium]|nr:hypothetical protein [Candidatus Paceibacterota bacterium]